MNQPTQPTRRRLLQALTALAVPAWPATRAAAAVSGTTASWAINSDPGIYAQAYAARFTNTLVNPLSTTAVNGVTAFYANDPGVANQFTIDAVQGQQNVLGIAGRTTTIWGYKNFETAAPSFPGRSFQVQRGTAITVSWKNSLKSGAGPLPHVMPVDQTISIQAPTTGVPLAVHHHGGDTAFEFDGGPDQWATPVRQQVGPGITAANTDTAAAAIRYQYSNAQEASMHWYHDHAEGLTRINVNAGLAGLYVVRDSNEALLQNLLFAIPKAPYEVALVLQDRSFDASGNMSYSANPADYPDPDIAARLPANQPTHMPEMFGDVILVNGKAWPNLQVEPRPYRLRLLNGSDSRFYTLKFGSAPVYQIGGDLGLLNHGVAMGSITIAPGERVDLVVDFGKLAGTDIVVGNSAPTPFPGGDPAVGGATVVMRIQVRLPLNAAVPLTSAALLPLVQLRTTLDTPALNSPATNLLLAQLNLLNPPKVRRVLLGEGTDEYGRILPLLGTYDPASATANKGTLSFHDPATEKPTLGSTEIWEFWNVTNDAHPVHMHLVKFQIIDRRPFTAARAPAATTMSNGWTGVKLDSPTTWAGAAVPAPKHEESWKDTVVCPSGQVTRVLVKFERRGKYVYHCHILSHEEHDMMRWYEVV